MIWSWRWGLLSRGNRAAIGIGRRLWRLGLQVTALEENWNWRLYVLWKNWNGKVGDSRQVSRHCKKKQMKLLKIDTGFRIVLEVGPGQKLRLSTRRTLRKYAEEPVESDVGDLSQGIPANFTSSVQVWEIKKLKQGSLFLNLHEDHLHENWQTWRVFVGAYQNS